MFFKHLATQHNVKTLVSLQQQLSNLHVDIKLIHILGHIGVPGNDTADSLTMSHISYLEEKNPHRILYLDLLLSRLPGTSLLNRGNALGTTITLRSHCTVYIQTKVLFPLERDIGISYVRLLFHDTMLEDDSYSLQNWYLH